MSITCVMCAKCSIFMSFKSGWFLDGHVYCFEHKPEGAVSLKDAEIYTKEGDD